MYICGSQSIYVPLTAQDEPIYESLGDDEVISPKEQNMYLCGNEAIYIPISDCDECGSLIQRLKALEDLLEGKTDVHLSMTDTLDDTVTVTVLGSVE